MGRPPRPPLNPPVTLLGMTKGFKVQKFIKVGNTILISQAKPRKKLRNYLLKIFNFFSKTKNKNLHTRKTLIIGKLLIMSNLRISLPIYKYERIKGH